MHALSGSGVFSTNGEAYMQGNSFLLL